jgi:arylsulfatase A-like enzyme
MNPRPPHRELLWPGLAILALAGGCSGEPPAPPPNILLIETDDQRWDTLWATPRIRRELAGQGVTFTQAVVSNPLCCPSRASLLAGGYYSHNVGVLTVTPPNGGADRFDDGETLAVALQRRGYRTGLVGKYLTGYDKLAPRVPPGWDLFLVRLGPLHFFNHRLLRGTSSADAAGRGRIEERRQYLTHLERDEALAFLAAAGGSGRPFFLWLATHAPHRPATALARDAAAFPDFEYRDRGWGEEDLGDKPEFIGRLGRGFVPEQGGARPAGEQPGFPADFPQRQVRSLRALDRAVGNLLDRLQELRLADRTVVLFTSDNGMLWGEHRLYRKGLAYEEAIRVPLLVRMPGLAAGVRDHLVAIDLDLAPTILELAGLPARGDGASLLPILRDPAAAWRQQVFLEGFGIRGVPPWAAVRSRRFKYVEYADGQRELYDLERDPFELASRHGDPAARTVVTELARWVEERRGLAARELDLPTARVGRPYAAALSAWGGRPPYTWEVEQGSLPAGLALDPGGFISGVPLEPLARPFLLRVTDTSASRRDGRPQSFRRLLRIALSPGPEGRSP